MKPLLPILLSPVLGSFLAACTLIKEPEPDMQSPAPVLVAATAPASPLPKPPVTLPQPPAGYTLVWHDEFNTDGPLNPNDWGYENGFVRNQEAQFYQPDNAFCKDGLLVIEARKESKPNPNYLPPGSTPGTTPVRGGRGRATVGWPNLPTIDITSASVNTRNKHTFTYGIFEIRAKIDTRPGSWPAFWSLGSSADLRWPANGEIDIMEYYRNTVLANIAWAGTSGATWNSVKQPLNSFPKDFSDQFHTWRMDWDATAIKLYLDDVLVNQQDLSKTLNPARGGATAVNPFLDRPLYLLLNQAIGGQNGGDPSHTQFPITFYVDYVRVYQKTPQ